MCREAARKELCMSRGRLDSISQGPAIVVNYPG